MRKIVLLNLAWLSVAFSASRQDSPPAGNGPYPLEVTAWTEAEKEEQRGAGRGLLRMLEEAAASGETVIRVPKGNYRFADVYGPKHCPAHLVLLNLRNRTVDFQGSTLWFETAATGILIRNSLGTTVKNAFLDWDPLPFVQGVVEAVDEAKNTLVVRPDEDYGKIPPGMSEERYWRGAAFSPAKDTFKEGQIGWGVGFSKSVPQPDGTWRFPFLGFREVKIGESGLAAGDPVALWTRKGHGIVSEGNSGCTLEKITLFSCPFIGFIENTGDGATRYVECRILRRPGTDRLLGGNADGFNVACVRRGPVIESCEIDTIGDDFVNVHHYFSRVLWQDSPTDIIISPICYQGGLKGPVTLEFFDRRTMRRLGERKAMVEEVRWNIEKDRCLADLSVRWMAGEAGGLAYGKTVRAHRITLDEPLEIPGDAIASCREFSSPGAVIRDNVFRGSLARGLRLQSPDVRVEGNTIENVAGVGISLCGQPANWGEGPYVERAEIVRNVLRNLCMNTRRAGGVREPSGPARTPPDPADFPAAIRIAIEGSDDPDRLQDAITIERNTIDGTGGAVAIFARRAGRLMIRGNRFEHILEYPPSGPPGVSAEDSRLRNAIVLDGVREADVADNMFENNGKFLLGEEVRIETSAVGSP